MNWVFEFGITCFRLESHYWINSHGIYMSVKHTHLQAHWQRWRCRAPWCCSHCKGWSQPVEKSFESLLDHKERKKTSNNMISTNQESKSKDARESHRVPGSRCQLFHQAFVPGWKIPSINVDNQTFISASFIPFNVTFNLILKEVDLTWMWQTYKL